MTLYQSPTSPVRGEYGLQDSFNFWLQLRNGGNRSSSDLGTGNLQNTPEVMASRSTGQRSLWKFPILYDQAFYYRRAVFHDSSWSTGVRMGHHTTICTILPNPLDPITSRVGCYTAVADSVSRVQSAGNESLDCARQIFPNSHHTTVNIPVCLPSGNSVSSLTTTLRSFCIPENSNNVFPFLLLRGLQNTGYLVQLQVKLPSTP